MWLLLFLHLNRQSLRTTKKEKKRQHQHQFNSIQFNFPKGHTHHYQLFKLDFISIPLFLRPPFPINPSFPLFIFPSVDPKWPLFSTPLELAPLCHLPTPYILPTPPSFTLPDPSLLLVFFFSLFC